MRVVLIGVGGATCSGKTTLAKYLRRCLPNSFIVHQDDFAPPQELVPWHPGFNVQDWDDAPGAIDWPRMRSALAHVKATGQLPPGHSSHDHLNEQVEIPAADDTLSTWRTRFSELDNSAAGEEIQWVIVDGFLLYWDKGIADQLDIRLFLRVPHDVLRQRRHARHGYHTAEGSLWRDPPHYWEQIVYPAYVRAHQSLFEGGDIENGNLTPEARGRLLSLKGQKTVQELLDKSCQAIVNHINNP
ncbi:hypothetical protein BS47DRAFT_1330451 [Hydnum rufescens UP504]|uniref:P-loop containing nucleoside triphosphate hydrolase protein n=1 Tax=Hydnum rufescens UP504 TaxID=1448309 RepID=A0A9P6DUZ7_9AGAM|nr:hypothetical protein BS47DRAFT_1330451 [Hydnum rufescens UP504]